MSHTPRIGIALGSGSSRGWAHIGVLRALAERGIHPDIVCGCSVGSIVGAAYVAGHLDTLETGVLALNRLELMRFFELNPSLNGFVNRDKLQQFFQEHVCDEHLQIEQLPRKFASVATNLENGREVWFTQGTVLEAVFASIALPGLFTPYRYAKQWLVDGGLVNPVPISLCRALGAEVVIAVNLNGNVARRYAHHTQKKTPETLPSKADNGNASKTETFVDTLAASLRGYSAALLPDTNSKPKEMTPGLMDALAASINIMQDKITRSRMAGDPPEILLMPQLEHIGLLEFHRAGEAIAEGYATVERLHAEINRVVSS
ncbi:NTE family protein [Thiothrix caldifontis]|jgi:Predicted esterase of the alpha-beta hydrolase superfamily|uniref:NTE family protein n=1 Tax=Thiothrix caldifontis TaxID=525918 RepID=A0A1H4FJJ2_9GAMM|nr:patatin-like phospholipase family protein [Thiothrix caldifontis]SEA97529.1 NTE family protein [Thiothrix caldifontis]